MKIIWRENQNMNLVTLKMTKQLANDTNKDISVKNQNSVNNLVFHHNCFLIASDVVDKDN